MAEAGEGSLLPAGLQGRKCKGATCLIRAIVACHGATLWKRLRGHSDRKSLVYAAFSFLSCFLSSLRAKA